MTEQDLGQSFDWDMTEAEDTSNDFVLLQEGEYPFIVESLTKKRFDGSEKMSACPKAELKLTVDAGEQGIVTIIDSIMLHSKMQYRIAQFFESLGFPKNPETGRVQTNWDMIIGRQGVAKIGPRTYTSKGEERQTNDVKKYLNPADWPAHLKAPQAAPPAPVVQQPVAPAPVPQQPVYQQQAPVAPQQAGFQTPQGGF